MLRSSHSEPRLSRSQRDDAGRARGGRPDGPGRARALGQRVERPPLRSAGQGRRRRRPDPGSGASGRRRRRDRLHRRAAPRATTSPSAAPPKRSSRPDARHLIASAIEHEAVLNTLKALAARGWRVTLLPVDHSGIVSPDALRDVDYRRHGARLGDARQQRDRNRSADRRTRRDRQGARRAGAHRCGADRRQDPDRRPRAGRRSAVDLWRTSSMAPRAPARCGCERACACALHDRRPAGAQSARGHRERPGIVGLGAAAQRALSKMMTRTVASRPARPPRDGNPGGCCRRGAKRRGRAAGAEHDQHQLRAHRIRVAADWARPRRHRGVVGVGLLVGHARTIARAEGDGPSPRANAELDSFQPRRRATPRRTSTA